MGTQTDVSEHRKQPSTWWQLILGMNSGLWFIKTHGLGSDEFISTTYILRGRWSVMGLVKWMRIRRQRWTVTLRCGMQLLGWLYLQHTHTIGKASRSLVPEAPAPKGHTAQNAMRCTFDSAPRAHIQRHDTYTAGAAVNTPEADSDGDSAVANNGGT